MDGNPPDRLRLLIFDLDGVIYRGEMPIPGAAALVAWAQATGLRTRFATNNSMATRHAYAARLGRMGIAAVPDDIVTSTSATIGYLRRLAPEVATVLAVGGVGLVEELRDAAFSATPAQEVAGPGYDGGELPSRYDAVVTGLDIAFDYMRLAVAAAALRAGARFVATNADMRYPTHAGFLPGAGAMVAALAAAGGVAPTVIGKPEPAMFAEILDRDGVAPGEALVIGDNPDSDIVAARRAGIASVLVLTGVADRGMVEGLAGERRPGAVADGPTELRELIAQRLTVGAR
ncbi:MAG: HAD-IIA family hydrolase [Candidatus Limnocylindria bacterium]